MIDTRYISLLTIAASILVPLLVEWAKKRFGKDGEEQKQGHEKHQEIMAELAQAKADRAAAEKSEGEWQAKFLSASERIIALVQDNAAKDRLISILSEDLPGLMDKMGGIEKRQ